MNKYAQAAIDAARLCSSNPHISPRAAWDQATARLFGAGTDAQKKGCPRNAFLGLCEEGFVRGVPRDHYCHSVKNKRYALSALTHIRQDPALLEQPKLLWQRVLGGESKVHNSQMDIVIALWNTGQLCQP